MQVTVLDTNTGKRIHIPKAMYERQGQNHPEWELIDEDIREPLRVQPLDEVAEHIAKVKECCKEKPDSEFIELARKVEDAGLTEEATECLTTLLESTEPEEKEPVKQAVKKKKPVKRVKK